VLGGYPVADAALAVITLAVAAIPDEHPAEREARMRVVPDAWPSPTWVDRPWPVMGDDAIAVLEEEQRTTGAAQSTSGIACQ